MKVQPSELSGEKWNAQPAINLYARGIMDVKEYFGGWANFVEQFPGGAYKYAQAGLTPELCTAFINRYSSLERTNLIALKRCLEMRRIRKISSGPSRPTTFMGSTEPDQRDTTEANWRTSNVLDNGVRALEDSLRD